jgi:multidrug efflux pump subunit AcrB
MVHAALIVLAFFELSRLPVELSPESDFPRLSVVTAYPGASSELVVESVTLPIEEAAATLDQVKDISSTSEQGESTVDIELQKDAKVDLVRLDLLEKLSAVAGHLPDAASFPTIAKYVPKDFRDLQGFMTYTVYGDLPLSKVEKYAEDRIKPQLLTVKGVASVRILGGARRELYVLVDRNKMRAYGVKCENVLGALRENQYVQSGGEIATGNVRESALVGSAIKDLGDVDNMMIERDGEGKSGGPRDGGTVRLGDFARVIDSISAPTAFVRINGKPSVTIEVDKEPGTNMLSVSSAVDSRVPGIVKRLPADMRIEKISDRSLDIRREVDELAEKSFYAGVLILIVVFFFFFRRGHLVKNFVVSVLMVVSVAFSVGAGLIFLSVSGTGLNVITLAALALSLGIAIDNNVVVSESIYREMENGGERGEGNREGGEAGEDETENRRSGERQNAARRREWIVSAEKQVWLPLVAATLTTVGALLPVFFLPPELREFFIPFAETTAVVVISSLVVAFTFLPVSMMLTISPNVRRTTLRRSLRDNQHSAFGHQRSGPKAMDGLKRVYVPISKWLINHTAISVLIAVWLVGFPIWLLPERIDYSPGTIQGPESQVKTPASAVLSAFSSLRGPLDNIVSSLASAYNATVGSDFYQQIRPYVDYGLGGATQLFFRHVYKGEIWQFGSETYLVMSVSAPQGTPIKNIDEFAEQMENVILPEKQWFKRMTTRVTPQYASVRINFADSVASTSVPFIFKDELTSLAAQAGGFIVSVSGFGPGFYSGGESSPSFTVTVTGYNYESVRKIAESVRKDLLRNPRVDNVQIDRLPWESENYEVHGYVNRDYLNSLGINVRDFMGELTPFVSSSLERTSILINDQPVDLAVKFNDYSNQSTGNLPHEEVDIGNGKTMSIGDAVSFRRTAVMPVIQRDNQQYIRYITFDFKGPYKYGDMYTEALVKSIPTPPGYEVKRPNPWFTFESKETIPLVLLSALAVLIVFMVTASLYESYKKPLIVILSVPMSLIGLFCIYFVADANFGRGGYAAVLFLIGLSVNNGILLVDKISSIVSGKEKGEGEKEEQGIGDAGTGEKERIGEPGKVGLGDFETGGKEARSELIAEAASERVRPILMTTLVTVAGFVPFVINADIYSFWYSFSLGIIGGIVASSLMVLLFTPVFYDLLQAKGKR